MTSWAWALFNAKRTDRLTQVGGGARWRTRLRRGPTGSRRGPSGGTTAGRRQRFLSQQAVRKIPRTAAQTPKIPPAIIQPLAAADPESSAGGGTATAAPDPSEQVRATG